MKALILVDIQNDFMPGGSLAVRNANHLIPLINTIIQLPFDFIVATKDWHPPEHGSFASNHSKKQVGELIKLGGIDQILWPAHCIQETWGAEFAEGFDTSRIDKIIYKGTNPLIDSYSCFYDNEHLKTTGLESYLEEKGIRELFILGLTTDYCVKYTVLDALRIGLRPYVIVDGCKAVNLLPNDEQLALDSMEKAGAALIYSSECLSENFQATP